MPVFGQNAPVRISAKEDYAVRAVLELAIAEGGPLKREQIAQAQEIPTAFLQNILVELRHAEIVEAQRGREGGFRLARPAAEITVADVVRAVSGPLATVRGVRPPAVAYDDAAEPLRNVWVAVRANIRAVLEHVTLADLASGKLPPAVNKITRDPAREFGLALRGEIKEGNFADLACFKSGEFKFTVVNGKVAVKDGEFQNLFSGKALRRASRP